MIIRLVAAQATRPLGDFSDVDLDWQTDRKEILRGTSGPIKVETPIAALEVIWNHLLATQLFERFFEANDASRLELFKDPKERFVQITITSGLLSEFCARLTYDFM